MTHQNIDIAALGVKLQLTPELISAALRQLEDDLKVTVMINRAIIALGVKLQLTPELISAALRQLEDDLKVTVMINRAIIALGDELGHAPNLLDDAEWEKDTQATLEAEAAEAAKKAVAA